MFESVTAFFMSVLIALFGFFSPEIPEAKAYEEIGDLYDLCEEYPIADTVYVLDAGTFSSKDERHLAVALQGIVAKTTPAIYIKTNSADAKYIEEMKNSGINFSYTDENGERWTTKKLLSLFISHIKDGGYTLYKESKKAEGLNMATNLATLNGWLPVPESLEDMAIDAGLTKKEDFSDDIYNVLFQWHFFSRYKQHFNNKAICHLQYEVSGIRDLAIQQGFFVFYIDEDTDGNLFRERVMQYFGDNAPMLGWVKYEVNFVEQASKTGNMAIPSDHSHNNSILASFECTLPLQKATKDTYNDTSKHYAALVMSDGDNVQWIQNGYSEFYKKLALKNDFPVTWSFPPLMADLSPVTLKKVYSDATENDYFMAGVSGAGYMHPTEYPADALTGFTDLTASAMAKSDLDYVQLLDSVPGNAYEELLLINRLGYYSRYDNIKGGVLSLDPTRYEGGKGKIWFSDDKPFISYRLSLWHPDGEGAAVTNEWLEEQAEKINALPADINSINGYSVINIHPWTVSIENLDYFVSCLDDDVVLVTVEELMEMITENIPHENAQPYI